MKNNCHGQYIGVDMRILMAGILMVVASNAVAQISVDGVNLAPNNRSQVGGGLTLSDIEYEVDDTDVDAERTILHGVFSRGLGSVDGIGYLGLVVDGELKNDGSDIGDGQGFLIGGGVRGQAYASGATVINWLTTLTYNNEKFEEDSVEVKLTGLELQAAGLFQYLVSRSIGIYGGVHLFPFTDGKYKVEAGGSSNSEDYERDSILGLSAGANFTFGRAFLRPEIRLIGQQSLSFNAGTVL